MKFNSLRLSGFKSFVEPTELAILPGLTGIVGPNGCGKSNLLEALRWVMGETSYKSMRGSGMEDVIFTGTNTRPSRNHAEVALLLGNEARTAPAEYNDADMLEVVRRIERDAGSLYRINGHDVRARDVQLLFADASTGARSNALVKQGTIGALISAKPDDRRKVLEEAAGISGLHSRRHEAELRLRGAESNLEKLADVIGNLEIQLRQSKQQVRQATRYKNISAQIREIEALVLHLRWREAQDALEKANEEFAQAQQNVAQATQISGQASTAQSNAQAALPDLRKTEMAAAAALRRLKIEQEGLNDEARRAEEMVARLGEQLATIDTDNTQAQADLTDAQAQLAKLTAEEKDLAAYVSDDETAAEQVAIEKQQIAENLLAEKQQDFDTCNQQMAEYTARTQALEERVQGNLTRKTRLEGELKAAQKSQDALAAEIDGDFDLVARRAAQTEADKAHHQAVKKLKDKEAAYIKAQTAYHQAVEPAREAQARLERLAGERTALAALFDKAGAGDYPALLDSIKVAPEYEKAVAAILGNEVEASDDEAAPAFWQNFGIQQSEQALPDNVASLAEKVSGTKLLARCLSQVGIVTHEQGEMLQSSLKPGQALVSREGDLWRWDGYCTRADAPVAAATRLRQRNRLDELVGEMEKAEKQAEKSTATQSQAETQMQEATAQRDEARLDVQNYLQQATSAAQDLAQAQAALETRRTKLQAMQTAIVRLQNDLAEMADTQDVPDDTMRLQQGEALASALAAARKALAAAREVLAQAQSELQNVQSHRVVRDSRLQQISEDCAQWKARQETAKKRIEGLATRRQKIVADREKYAALPASLADKNVQLADTVRQAETTRQQAADALAVGENALAEADRAERQAGTTLSQMREAQARLEAVCEAAQTRHDEASNRIEEILQVEPEQALAIAGHKELAIAGHKENEEDAQHNVEELETRLEKLRRDRENLGGVNLRADEEVSEIEAEISAMVADRDELTAAINKLRHGIGQLNREGRQRLLSAFETVNGHFKRLFTQLFGGGTAQLELTQSDDPLQAGLEIIAHPPGKKPQLMSLLSGGEQALTAMSLVFAVFLTNPSPICVLDEVDAPLDDSNVERFCNLLKEISAETDTRFLIITHHALTMARMDRLFGVVMQERGVSELLSVDLTTAEQFAESGDAKIAEDKNNIVKSIG